MINEMCSPTINSAVFKNGQLQCLRKTKQNMAMKLSSIKKRLALDQLDVLPFFFYKKKSWMIIDKRLVCFKFYKTMLRI